MKDFKGKVAVVTGAGSGIGRAMAERFASEGMKVVLADVQPDALAQTEKDLKAKGAEVISRTTDVSKGSEIEALAQATLDAFGKVHVVCNNAGVAVAGFIWERTVADWEWVMGVNLWGVIHGVRVFTPIMMKQGEEGHIVNTASMAGLISGPSTSIYSVTKHAVVTLSESLYHELKMVNSKIGASVLCPAWVATKIVDSGRNRPESLPTASQEPGPQDQMLDKMIRNFVTQGMDPAKVAHCVFNAIREQKFYILTHPEWKDLIRMRMEDILNDKNPTYRPMT